MGLPSNYFQEVEGEFLTCEWSEANPDTGKTHISRLCEKIFENGQKQIKNATGGRKFSLKTENVLIVLR